MTHDEYQELKAAVEEVALRDVHTGRVLHAMLLHLAGKAAVPAEEEAVPVEEEPSQPTPIPRRASRQQP